MIQYDYTCSAGHRFEDTLASMFDPDPACPSCGATARRRPPAVGLGNVASPGPSRDQMPRSWQGVKGGDPETVDRWRRTIEKREKLEDKYSELAGDRRPVLAHEGIFASKPLRAGDDVSRSVGEAVLRSQRGSTEEPDRG